MASIAEITQGSNYVGNRELGGFIPTAIEIDTKPLQALAGYTVMYNRDQYNQRQKDANGKIAQLADLSKYDIANARGKDKEMAMKVYADLQNKMRDYASRGVPISPEEKVQQEVELKTTVNDAITKIKALNGRGIAYNARLNAINQDANASAAVKSIRKKQLDEEFDSTEWDTPISSEERYSVTLPKIGEPVYTKNTTSVDTGNEIVQQEVQIFNPAKNLDNATADVFNFSEQTTLPENATPEQRRQFEIQQATGGTVKVLNDAASFLNAALADPKYKNEDGTVNTQAVAADNRIAAGILNGIDRYNKYAEDLKQDIINGFYTTKLGSKVNLLNIIKESDVFTIDKNKPLSPEQLVFVQKFLDAAPDQKDEKVIVTGEENTRLNILLDAENQRKNREEQARQFDLTRQDSNAPITSADGNTQTTGNAFDEIGGTKEIALQSGGKISNGIVVDKNNNVYTGEIVLRATDLPSNMMAALNSSKIELPTEGFINVVVKNGVIVSVNDTNGKPISRQGMENAQKKFDTEEKGQVRTQWGRLLEANVLPTNNNPTPTNTTQNTITVEGKTLILPQ